MEFGKDAEHVYKSMAPELPKTKRFSVSMRVEGGKLIIRVCAQDLSALRAALNSYLRWLMLLRNVLKVVDAHGNG